MTVGILQAMQLRDTLRKRLKPAGSGVAQRRRALAGLPREFHRQLPAVLDFPWTLATGEDLRRMSGGVPKADVAVPLPKKLVEGYFQYLKEVSADDPVVLLAFWKVFHMVSGPEAMFAPGLLLRAVRYWLTAKLQGGSHGGSDGGAGTSNSSGLSQPAVAAAEVIRG
jgi:hypothetical protein